jgi:phosphoglycolate phosphatase
MNTKGIIFDLDGTLIDSLQDIAFCANEVLKELGIQPHPIEAYKHFVGDGAQVLIENALGNPCNKVLVQQALKRFKTIYEHNIHNNTHAYEGIMPLLETLTANHFKLGVLSNKPHEFTCKYVQKIFSSYEFLEVHGQKENVPKKPDPQAALAIAKNFNINAKEIFFVGDTATDIKTAHNAGMISIGVLWGFRDKQELEEAKANYIVQHPLDIIEIVKNHSH